MANNVNPNFLDSGTGGSGGGGFTGNSGGAGYSGYDPGTGSGPDYPEPEPGIEPDYLFPLVFGGVVDGVEGILADEFLNVADEVADRVRGRFRD
jgi:hypothetical protein